MKPLLLRAVVAVWASVLLAGCVPPKKQEIPKQKKESIIGKTTQEVVEFNPADGHKIKDTNEDSILGQAYGGAAGKIVDLRIVQELNLYQAVNERFPKTHQEFMTEIIKKSNIQLPMLPHGSAYAYDVANHKLVVIKDDKNMDASDKIDPPGDN